MRLVHLSSPGHLELNYMWMPTWIGMNRDALETIEAELRERVLGQMATEETLDEINELTIELLVQKYPVAGLRDYLDGLKFVHIQ